MCSALSRFSNSSGSGKAKPCAGMKGLIEEGEEVIGEDASEALMDAAIIGAAQRVEHYEMAAYGTARTFAERLGNEEAAALLEETLNEEKEADEKLTEISEQLLEGMQDMESGPAAEEGAARKTTAGRRTRTSQG